MDDYYILIAILISLMLQGISFVYLYSMLVPTQKEKFVVPDSPPVQAFIPPEEIFVSFACTNCNSSVVLYKRIEPGEVAVLDCDNCNVSWTIYNPQLIIKPTKELPEPIKVRVAENSLINVSS